MILWGQKDLSTPVSDAHFLNDKIPDEIKVRIYNNISSYNIPVEPTNLDICDLVKKGDRKIHEYLDHNTIVKPYYDIDYMCETEEEMNNQFIRLKDLWINELTNIFNCSVSDLGISSCNRYKKNIAKKHGNKHYIVSFHIIINNKWILLNNIQRFNYINKINQLEGYDDSVYKNGQNFRIINQSKPEIESKCFVPYNNKDDIFKHIIQVTKDKEMKFFDMEELYVEKPSPPVSPITSEEEPFDLCNYDELKKLVLGVKNKYEYLDWIKMCFIIIHETGGSEQGYDLFLEWSKLDINFDTEKKVRKQWEICKKSKPKDKRVTIGTLKSWYKKENYKSENPYKDSYYEYCKWNDYDKSWEGTPNITGMVELLNKKLMYNLSTSEIITINGDEWYSKKPLHVRTEFECYEFKDIKNKPVNPVQIWLKNIKRKNINKIVFDPKTTNDTSVFNLWKGYHIKLEDCKNENINDCKPILDHIFNIWCDGNQKYFDYTMNWISHIMQKPYKKMGVVVCLKSKEGAGKNIIINKITEIIGRKHSFVANNIKKLTGDFNGLCEEKTFCNLDEAFWGKDKKLEGEIKNIITEETKYINKKNKEAYIIDDFCNFLITTNNICFIPATEGGRRFFCLDLNNKFSGIQDDIKKKYFDKISDASTLSFAKYLYTRDISEFNPRDFVKTELLQKQVEQNWDSVRNWWFDIIKYCRIKNKKITDGSCNLYDKLKCSITGNELDEYQYKFKYKYDKNRHKIEGEVEEYHLYDKEFLYECYSESCCGYKYSKKDFYERLKNDCLDEISEKDIQLTINGEIKRYIRIKDIKILRSKWNELQQWNYQFEDYYIDGNEFFDN